MEYQLTEEATNTQEIVVRVNPTPILTSDTHDTVCSGVQFTYVPTSSTSGATYTWNRSAVSGITPATGSGSGNLVETLINTTASPVIAIYVFTVTANGCSSTATVVKTVNAPVPVPVIVTNTPVNVCSNTKFQNFGAATLPASGLNYNWSASNAAIWSQGANHQYALVNFPNPGTAVVYLKTNIIGAACSNTDSFIVNVSSSVSDNVTVIYYNSRFVASPGNEDSYQWGYDDKTTLDSTMLHGEVNQDYYNATPDFGNKSYWVINTHNGCMQKTYFNSPLGVTETNEPAIASINVFPNPTDGNINIEVSANVKGDIKYEIANMIGQQYKVTTAGNSVSMNVTDLPAGVYIITCTQEGTKIASTRFIKN
ncbi:MAG: T9SS type A sorting domain-containing protein [Taibaiella sp.]|nr:T9SS type A sorting domain-containing protein [Taibaiella sp.]